MAIKTKKIAELSEITSNGSFLLGQNGNVTGKISYSSIMNEVEEKIATAIANIPTEDEDKTENVDTVTNDRFISLSNKVENNITQISTVAKTQATLEGIVASSSEKMLLLEQEIQNLKGKNEKLEKQIASLVAFVHSLQADGYLTLANIKRLAAEHCPCEQETHDGEQSEQPTE